MKYLVVDLECTDQNMFGVTEIIEFGYAVVSENRVEKIDGEFIKPTQSKLSPFIKELTGITEKDIEHAPTFKQFFLQHLMARFNPREYVFVGWGNFDKNTFVAMCELWGVDVPRFAGWINLKNEHKRFHGFKDERGLKRALNHAGLGMLGQHHRGVDDAHNTARLFIDMRANGWDPKFG